MTPGKDARQTCPHFHAFQHRSLFTHSCCSETHTRLQLSSCQPTTYQQKQPLNSPHQLPAHAVAPMTRWVWGPPAFQAAAPELGGHWATTGGQAQGRTLALGRSEASPDSTPTSGWACPSRTSADEE